MIKKFSVFKSHTDSSCDNCGGDFGPGGWYFKTGADKGRGQYKQHCEKCRTTTTYDLKDQK
jgi:hypothetical protein